eukprot:gene459-282_t
MYTYEKPHAIAQGHDFSSLTERHLTTQKILLVPEVEGEDDSSDRNTFVVKFASNGSHDMRGHDGEHESGYGTGGMAASCNFFRQQVDTDGGDAGEEGRRVDTSGVHAH